MPLLHRPTFEQGVASGLHLRDSSFGGLVLLICAIGSRFSNDPRVFLEGAGSTLSSGWKWFQQVRVMKKNVLIPPTLYDVQYCCVSSSFLRPNERITISSVLSSLLYFYTDHPPRNQFGH
jgi:hypothetical protein